MLNVESQFLPGDDAAYVKAATDALIKEAVRKGRKLGNAGR
ncbi:MAG: hypothetical protein WB528_24125 [Bradyrhizobium sp.]|jgi:hypothetical protein